MTIIEFLTARYDEAEGAMRQLLEPGWTHDGVASPTPDEPLARVRGWTLTLGHLLADNAAKRAILQAWAARAEDDHPAISAHRTGLGLAIKLLAQPFADHPDFDESWKP